MKKSYTFVLVLFLFIQLPIFGQCPDNKGDRLLNTQEKYDAFFEKYPDCTEYKIVMMNGKFIGDPRPIGYLITLSFIYLGILIVLKVGLGYLKLE